MYRLLVLHAEATRPTQALEIGRASEVLSSGLLASHPDCARIDVYINTTKLFSVDCEGNRLPD
jgi:hypothetical protein